MVMDSEGLGATDEAATHDIKVFCLSAVLSSMMIYNSLGTIDEGAVQNLNLVINLSKKMFQTQSKIIDPVQFVWVVRDFTLQLVNEKGAQLSDDQYLELALCEIEAGSEEKNQARQCIKEFFPLRKCFTLVRPVLDETQLQNLESMELIDFRHEFYSQIVQMRSQLLDTVKPKCIAGKEIDGNQIARMAEEFVKSVNDGIIPDIQSTWELVVSIENEKFLQMAIEDYEQRVNECLAEKFPMTQEEIISVHELARKSAIELFKKKAFIDGMENYLNTIKGKLNNSLQKLLFENQKESQVLIIFKIHYHSKKICTQFLQREFSYIDQKLKQKKYTSFLEFETDVKLFMHFYDENCPEVMNKHIYLLDYLLKATSDAAKLFILNFSVENEAVKSLNTEMQKKFSFFIFSQLLLLSDTTIQSEKEELLKEQNKILTKLTQLQAEKAEFDAKETYYLQDIAQLKTEKESIQNQLKLQLSVEKDQNTKKIQELEIKIINQEEEIKKLERKLLFSDSEKDKDNALLSQQNNYLEKIIEDLNKKEKDMLNELNQKSKETVQQIKEINNKYEGQIKVQADKITEIIEKNQDLENELQQNNEKFNQDRTKLEMEIKQLSFELGYKKEQITQLKLNLSSIETNDKINDSSFQFENQQQLVTTLESKSQNLEQLVKEKEEQVRQIKATSEKDKAVLAQKTEFLELQLTEMKAQMNENNRAHEAILKAFESSQSLGIQKSADQKTVITFIQNLFNLGSQLNEIKEKYESEISQLQRDLNGVMQQKQIELNRMKEGFEEEKREILDENSKFFAEIENMKENSVKNEELKQKLQDQLKTQEDTKLRLLNEYEQRYLTKTRQLEDQLEELKQSHSTEISQLQQESEDGLKSLKLFFEMERERLEKRMLEERERMNQKHQHLLEDTEGQWSEERTKLYDELEMCRQEFREKECALNQLEVSSDHEIQLWGQKVQQLEKFLAETRENLQQVQRQFSDEREQLRLQSMEERKQGIERIDLLLQENGKKDRELMKLEQEVKVYMAEANKKEAEIVRIIEEQKSKGEEETKKVLEQQKTIDDLRKEILEKRIENERECALLIQERSFSQKRIEELQDKLNEIQKNVEERVKNQKQEALGEISVQAGKWMSEKKQMEEKVEMFKKEKKELVKLSKQQEQEIQQLRVQKDQQEKQLDSMRNEWEMTRQLSEGEKETIVNNWQEECRQLQFEVDRMKQENLQLDQEKSDIVTNYERDQLLWESKFKFLEKQKDEAKQDWADSIKKFELTLQHMKKARQNDREDHEGQLNEILQTIEKKHQNELQDLTETHDRASSELQERIKSQEREIKLLNEKMLSSQGKYGSQMQTEMKMNDMNERERKLKQEIEKLKEDRDLKYNEYARFIEQERESWRAKVADIDSKYKLVESKRTQMIFDFEKERAKWNLQKDHQEVQFKEQQDTYEKLLKKYDTQTKELEKLKNESRISRRSINLMGVNQTSESINTSNINLNPSKNFKDVATGKTNMFNLNDFSNEQMSEFSSNKVNTKYETSKVKPNIAWQQINPKKDKQYF